MGTDKSWISIGGRPLVHLLAERLGGVFPQIVLGGREPAPFAAMGLRFLVDPPEGGGPMGAIAHALSALGAPRLFVCAVDLVGLDADAVSRLVAIAGQRSDAWLIAPAGVKGIEPLHAVYDQRLLPELRARLGRGEWSLQGLARAVPTAVVDPALLGGVGAVGLSGVNTPDELAAWASAREER
jgi:molybdopterin-guanine dinucleotide biosynthesis protein A